MKPPLLLVLLLAASLSTSSSFASDATGASDSPLPAKPAAQPSPAAPTLAPVPLDAPTAKTVIPGPLRSFLRMAGISQKATVDEVLPLLAQEVDKRGYVEGKPTEFLILLKRYMQQARELVALAG